MSPLELGLLQLGFVNYKHSFFPQIDNKFKKKKKVDFLEIVKINSIKEETWLKVKIKLKS